MRAGIARKVDLLSIGEKVFKDTLGEMLSNSVYTDRARRKSQLFRDQPETPIDRALWWIDYVMRNPEISHLKNKKLHEMNFIVKHSIDLFVLLIILLSTIVLVFYKVLWWLTAKKARIAGHVKVKCQ